MDTGSSELPALKINFNDGGEPDVAVLSRFDIVPAGRNEDPSMVDSCIYDGFLINEDKVYVTLTGGCAGSSSFEVGRCFFAKYVYVCTCFATSCTAKHSFFLLRKSSNVVPP